MGLHNLQIQGTFQAQIMAVEPVQPEPFNEEINNNPDYSLVDAEQLLEVTDKLLDGDPKGSSPHAAAEYEVYLPTKVLEPAVEAAMAG